MIMENKEQNIQEMTSVYFNNIIRRDVSPITVKELDPNALEEFNRQVDLAFTDEAETVKNRVRYLVSYILQNIDWQEYARPLEEWQLRYYYQRERFIQRTGLSWDRFMDHKPIQKAIEKLGLKPEPVFEFILFLAYYYRLRSDLRYSCVEQLDSIIKELDRDLSMSATMDVSIGGKHFKISNAEFLKKMFHAIERKQLNTGSFVHDFNQGSARDKVRAIDYYLVKTLLDYLATDKSLRRGGHFSQAERNFGLSLLNLCGRLPDIDRDGECSQENNATFDKLIN